MQACGDNDSHDTIPNKKRDHYTQEGYTECSRKTKQLTLDMYLWQLTPLKLDIFGDFIYKI